MIENPADLPILEAAERLRDGRLTSVALTVAHLDRIAERNGAYHAFLHVAAESALAEAARADEALGCGEDRGPLHGIPVAVKDLFDTAGMPTTYGSDVYAGYLPTEDAEVVRRLRAAGAVLIGKLETYEFAMVGPVFDRSFPPAANPWDVRRFTGGSSSGSAAAVAGGLVRTSVASDTGGSVRSPAAYCGVVGFKPTYGRIPARGVFVLSPSLDHVGLISASVAEAAITFDAIADAETTDAEPAASRLGGALSGLRIGYARKWFADDPETLPALLDAVDGAASQLSLLGARIEEVALPAAPDFESVGAVIIHAEAFEAHRRQLAASGDGYSRKVFQNILSGLCLTPEDLVRAPHAAARLRDRIDRTVFARFDAILTATTLTPAIPFADFAGEAARWTPMRTIAFNVTGHPALSVPCGFANGLPLAIQLAGRAGDEATLCQIGHAYEQASDFAASKPPLPFRRAASDGRTQPAPSE
ncbi:amidase [Sinorhizobium medicae]|uniref:amidase n=1 Tax=Sinorhizobium medicae TaxID=110321 RepID=UPI000424F1FE|nr:amidase [Sinorhizobium medicae]